MEICKFKDIDDVIPMWPEFPFFNDHSWKYEVILQRIDKVMNGHTKSERNNMHLPCNWPQRSRWPSRSHGILNDTMDYPDLCDQIVAQSHVT